MGEKIIKTDIHISPELAQARERIEDLEARNAALRQGIKQARRRNTKHAKWIPPEMLPALTEATIQWIAEAKKTSKMESLYSIAGQPGGLGIRNVDSLEEI